MPLILYFPLVSALCTGFLGFLIGRAGAFVISFTLMLITCLLAVYSLVDLIGSGNIYFYLIGTWVDSGILSVSWSFLYDPLSSIMCFVVTVVSCAVHLYSWGYMHADPHSPRFVCYLTLFTFFMLFLVLSDNMLMVFLGWEGIGICSFLLISFWTTRLQAVKAAVKAVMVNKIGDVFFLIAVSLIFYVFGSLDFVVIFSLVPFYKFVSISYFGVTVYVYSFISLCLLIAAVSKSAQFGLHTWLPDAMEGPTPVSALIHAATLVTAGVFLIVRCSLFFEFSPNILNLLLLWGSLTAFYGALVANFQTDIKKTIAYSTCSQLGYMFMSCGLSEYSIGVFHLLNHAFFKALLFLCAGAIIHSSVNEQDVRKLPVNFDKTPLISSALDIGLLCLISFPFFGGFYSKDLILEVGYSSFNSTSVAYYSGLLTAVLTAGYASMIAQAVTEDEFYSNKLIHFNRHDADLSTSISLLILAFSSIFSGFYFQTIFDFTSDFFFDSIFLQATAYFYLTYRDYVPVYIQLLPVLGVLVWLFFSMSDFNNFFLIRCQTISLFFFNAEQLFIGKFYVDNYFYFLVHAVKQISSTIIEAANSGFLELFGPRGLWSLLYQAGDDDRVLFSAGIFSFYRTLILFLSFYSSFLIFCLF